jgi:hypothetical protein
VVSDLHAPVVGSRCGATRRRAPAAGLRALTHLAWLVLAAFALAAHGEEVDVVVDPPILSLGESLTVTFSVAGDSSGIEPDFAPLTEQFDILRTNVRDTLQILNGRTTQTRVWRLTLVPREEGTIEIPALDFGGTSSPVRAITVSPARSSAPGEADVFIEVDVQPEGEVYVQSQVLLTVRLFLAVRVSNATLSDPVSKNGDVVVEAVAEERSERELGGRTYQVFEQRFALFPQRSGELELDPVVFSGDMRSYFERPTYRRVQSEPIRLQVRPAPSGAGDPWLPATEVTLTQEFPQANAAGVIEARVGEPITRSVTLSATGLTSAQLPPVEVVVPDEFKIYPDQPALDQRIVDNGLIGQRVERLSMLPTQPGEFELPAVEMRWWDVENDRPRTARLAPVVLRVQPAPGTELPGRPDAVAGGVAGAASGVAGRGPVGGSGFGAAGQTVVTDPGMWPWLALFLGLGWLTTGGLWWRRTLGLPVPTAPPTGGEHAARSLGAALRRVREACEANDVGLARQAVLAWGRARWSDHTVNDLIAVRRLGGEALARELDQLDASRYAAEGQPWDGRALAALVGAMSADADESAVSSGEGSLEPLYR